VVGDIVSESGKRERGWQPKKAVLDALY
jgi:hypothetical protein